MNKAELIDKYRDKAISAAIIILFLVIAVNILKGSSIRVESLKAKISEENKKSGELTKINKLERKITGYKRLLTKKEASLVMGNISDIAKGAGVEVLSVKPPQRELSGADYSKDVFEVRLNAPDYDSLARFISNVESSGNVYTVDNMLIGPKSGVNNEGLTVDVKISSVSAASQ